MTSILVHLGEPRKFFDNLYLMPRIFVHPICDSYILWDTPRCLELHYFPFLLKKNVTFYQQSLTWCNSSKSGEVVASKKAESKEPIWSQSHLMQKSIEKDPMWRHLGFTKNSLCNSLKSGKIVVSKKVFVKTANFNWKWFDANKSGERPFDVQ